MESVEIVAPSSPTPPHLRNLQLSFLDQLSPPLHIHIILFFQPLLHGHHTSHNLKRSLSEALSIYYPLAGRLRDGSWIDCNDAGVEYMEVRFNHALVADVVENSQPDEFKRYVPAAPRGGGEVPLAVQVSFFGCGGVAVGVCIAHRVADAMSMVMFINTWAAACRGDAKTNVLAHPNFCSASRFPAVDFSRFFPVGAPQQPPSLEKIVTRRFLFNKWKISALRKAASGPLVMNPTKVEVVSAFLWRHYMESVASRDGGGNKNRVFAATHVVDIRQRASPRLPHQYFGNACARATALAAATEASTDEPDSYYDLVIKLRSTIRKVDSNYVASMEKGEEFLKHYLANEENDPKFKDGKKTLEMCSFTSWGRLPAYEADYGWGKPFWVSIIDVPIKNLVLLLGTNSGDGIEAWVNMAEEDIAAIETAYNILQQVQSVVQPESIKMTL